MFIYRAGWWLFITPLEDMPPEQGGFFITPFCYFVFINEM
jgi:hypothetical protein